jgi:hypothetical protein
MKGETGLCAGNDFSPAIWCGQDVAAVQTGADLAHRDLSRDSAESAVRRTGRHGNELSR